jgi:hypothetical protein
MDQESKSRIIKISGPEMAQPFEAEFHAYTMNTTSTAFHGWAICVSDPRKERGVLRMTTPAFYYQIKVIRSEKSVFGFAESWLNEDYGRPKVWFWKKDVVRELERLRASTISRNITYKALRFDISTNEEMGVIE